jgi:hypothetical protein
MARPRKQTDLDQAIADILSSLAPQIASAVRDHLTRLVGGGSAPASATYSTTKHAATGRPKKYNSPTHCIAPGCTKQHGGPRSGFFCEEHQKLSVAAKTKIKADRKAGGSQGGKPTKASVGAVAQPKKRKLTAAGRKSLSDKMTARWAAKRAAAKKK